MKVYVLSLGAGLLVGVVYSLINVRSPAPPVIALVGLLGILLGEQVVPLARRVMAGQGITLAAVREDCAHHLFGALPSRPLPGRAVPPPIIATPTITPPAPPGAT